MVNGYKPVRFNLAHLDLGMGGLVCTCWIARSCAELIAGAGHITGRLGFAEEGCARVCTGSVRKQTMPSGIDGDAVARWVGNECTQRQKCEYEMDAFIIKPNEKLLKAVARMYRLRATCQQRQVLVRAVAWGYIMPISTGYKTNWQQSSTCGSMQARENRAHFPPPLLRLMCLLQSRTSACREACVDAPQEGRSGYGHGCRLLGAEWGPEFAMERAHKADEDDEGRAQEEDKSSDFDRRSKSAHTGTPVFTSHASPSALEPAGGVKELWKGQIVKRLMWDNLPNSTSPRRAVPTVSLLPSTRLSRLLWRSSRRSGGNVSSSIDNRRGFTKSLFSCVRSRANTRRLHDSGHRLSSSKRIPVMHRCSTKSSRDPGLRPNGRMRGRRGGQGGTESGKTGRLSCCAEHARAER
ncbi:hypothetical protein DFH08DRAFT_935646 [Mycena albidolilacea]|uniref:Uncharacterized protein n=1 Tax=Mycena albidolilacea TaxID=1033008 RepID=A0AAD7A542_9AGAR|nr:hypothetical protein DFH08DRAFT_935646 [Mycena albidolilacea]